MRRYILTTPKDADGQPRLLFKANFENNVSKAIDLLSGICEGILADGRKIERAVALLEGGSGISIISEEHWRSFLTST